MQLQQELERAAGRPCIWAEMPTRLGPMLAVADEDSLLLLDFWEVDRLRRLISSLQAREPFHAEKGSSPLLVGLQKELDLYFAGLLTDFRTPVRLLGSDFQREVWTAMQRIPCGETRTYGSLARDLGRPDSSRAVGAASGQNRLALIVPCHRVVGSSGSLTGYGGGLGRKRSLLELEGGQMPL